MKGRRLIGGLVVVLALSACKSNDPPPSPSPGPSPDAGVTITGRERIGWDQPASSHDELDTFRYAIYVDGTRREMSSVSCAATAGAAGYACSGQLPSMSPGIHVLEITAIRDDEDDNRIESARSAPLRVTVTGATTPAADSALAPGDVLTTGDGIRLQAALVVEGLSDAIDLALAPGGPLLVAERSGDVVVAPADPSGDTFRAATGARLLAVSPAPDFAASGHLYAMHDAGAAFRLSRYRLAGTQLVERMHVIRDVGSPPNPSASLRFGPDGKLYAALDAGGDADVAARLTDWRGKVLRLNPDGSTPEDQAAASPVFWSGLASPRAIGWAADGPLWLAERGVDGVERLRAIASTGSRPRRTGLRASYVLPGDVGAASLAFHDGVGAPGFARNMFVAARTGGYLLRVRFDQADGSKAMASEKLLEGRVGEPRAVAVGPDGALYLATATAVWRLSPVDR